jgi:hypothetical protein
MVLTDGNAAILLATSYTPFKVTGESRRSWNEEESI